MSIENSKTNQEQKVINFLTLKDIDNCRFYNYFPNVPEKLMEFISYRLNEKNKISNNIIVFSSFDKLKTYLDSFLSELINHEYSTNEIFYISKSEFFHSKLEEDLKKEIVKGKSNQAFLKLREESKKIVHFERKEEILNSRISYSIFVKYIFNFEEISLSVAKEFDLQFWCEENSLTFGE